MTTLQDLQGRTFPYLRLSVTDLCNFRCQYCLPDGCKDTSHRTAINLDEIRRIATAFASLGTNKIRISGGEPTLRTDFVDILKTIRDVPGIKTVAVTTNGYKMDQRVESWIDAGMTHLNVSIDSLEPAMFERITGHNRLDEILRGIDIAFAKGLPRVKVNSVLLKGMNDKELDRYLDWIKDKPITVRMIELMETGDADTFFQNHHLSGQIIQKQLLERGWIKSLRLENAGPAHEFCHPDYQGRIGLIMPYSKDFCADCNRLRVNSQGELQLCLFAEHGHSLRHLLQSDDQQELLNQRICELLNLKEDKHFLDQGMTGSTRNLSIIGG
ncbi:GTP 3',8-cyclase MoaA [Parendozoicomonas haliclonae]|uniref:GTP 3',8-cyclase n=1 Tax=Parendozoicomonas haliclonae TaxID=1960125 RepID=A0A1X7AEI3_9GAMM|nr:GTP 3',8-cyclase MoaA [Parendozoicomonas haliclonae]SMA34644.1 Cyclic pyranopterin monophosphate synthase [Parendozoicomonas haliclonae]